ncbi:fimbria/pilus outer membrane usher protein [Rugamonas sp.]|uniref:fimbria/pilus outer membrane usher protein n=1 Tax=Rugamonas sp. TaxID=1926287 RepID=UPI0025DEACDB|nr:fimbria/pilus outer membrane usher protein [Rugamonas sp.]
MTEIRRTWIRLLSIALLASLCLSPVRAQTTAPQQDELYLEVTLNGEATGLILRFTQGKAGLRSSVQNLRDLGLDPALFGVRGDADFELDAVRGLSYQYDAAGQSIALKVSDALRAPLALDARTLRKAGPATVTPGLVLNYDSYVQLGSEARLALVNELRYFNQAGVFTNTGVLNVDHRVRQYLRYDTSWSHSDPDTLRSWQVGDLISSSLSWSRSVRMGGLQWRKSFDLRPDLLTYPVASLNGSAVVPSAVSLYVNGVRQVDTTVPGGPFIINQVAGISGAGLATLVTHDATGRAISTTLPLYVDTRLLAAGLDDYSLELGALRCGYGSLSFDYARTPAVSASLRRGVSDQFTVEAHAEAGTGVANGGAGALLALGQAGVVNGALAASAGGGGGGGQLSVGYQYLSGRFSVDTQSTRATSRYSDLGTTSGAPVTRAADRVSVTKGLFGGQSVSLSYVSSHTPAVAPARVVSLSYTATLVGGLYGSVSAFRDLNDHRTSGLFFSLSMAFGRVSATATSGRQDGVANRALTLSRAPDFGGGFGWALQSGTQGRTPLRQAQIQYLGNDGQITAQTNSNGANRSSALDLNGALVLMDGSLQAARQVGAVFALVSTEGVAGVPVLQENREIGKTDRGGHLLVPNLNPYLNNEVGIDTTALPLDARIATTHLTVVPSRLAGVLALFKVEHYTAASIILHGADGKPLAVGTAVRHVESGAGSVVGYDGVAFIDNLKDDNHLRVGSGVDACVVRFAYRPNPDGSLPVIGPLLCLAVEVTP